MQLLPFAAVAGAIAAAVFRLTGKAYVGRSGLLLRALATVIVTCSASVFQLILCEVLQSGDTSTRAELWRVQTAVLLLLLGIVAPAVQIWRFFALWYPRLKIMAGFTFAVYLMLFRAASRQLPLERYSAPGDTVDPASWFALRQDSLACISFIGITTMALLCGISSISAPYSAFIGDGAPVTEVDAARLRESLRSIEEMVPAKELQISRLRLDLARRNGHSMSTPNLMTRLVGMVKTQDDRQAQLRSLQLELDALIKLRDEVDGDLMNVQQKIAQQTYFRTFRGQLHKIVYAVFAVYCIYRVANSYIRMGWWFFASRAQEPGRAGPRDALVQLLAANINRLCPDVGTLAWSRIIGVVMSGAVLAAALNGVLRTSQKVLRAMRKSRTALPLDPLLIAQVVGVYVLSIATTLRFNLPRSMSGPIMAALVSPLNVSSVQLWNDTVLCITSTIVLAILLVVNRLSADSIYDEEMGEFKHE